MAGGYPCCCGEACEVCGSGTTPVLQVTISGFGQTNTPPVITTPCGSVACTDLNKTVAIAYTGFPSSPWTPVDATLAADMDIAAGTTPCSYYYAEEICSTSAPDTAVAYEIFITLYAKDGGGVGLYVRYQYSEADPGEGYTGCITHYEALGTIEASGTTTDCDGLSETLTLSTKTASCFGGTPPVWCDGTIDVLLETAP